MESSVCEVYFQSDAHSAQPITGSVLSLYAFLSDNETLAQMGTCFCVREE